MKSFGFALAALSSAAAVAGHATFQQLWINGEDHESSCIRMPVRILVRSYIVSLLSSSDLSLQQRNNSPVTSVSSNDMRCNAGPSPAANVCEAIGTPEFPQ